MTTMRGYRPFLPQPLLEALRRRSQPHETIPGLAIAEGLEAQFPQVLCADALEFVCALYRQVRGTRSRPRAAPARPGASSMVTALRRGKTAL